MIENQVTICGHGYDKPSLKKLGDYTTNRCKSKASNGKIKGVAMVMRHKWMTATKRKKFKELYKSIIGRNIYSQTKRDYVLKPYSDGKYYSDCSSSGMAIYNAIGLNTDGWYLNTAGIYQSKQFKQVKSIKIKDGHILNPEKLHVGDCILYIGNDPARPLQIGHVEYVYHVDRSSK